MTTATEALDITTVALDKVRARRKRVHHVATESSDYVARAGARIQLEDVDQELAQLEAERATLAAAAEREQTIAHLIEHASAGAAALADAVAVQAELDSALLGLLERYSAARQRQHQARQGFYGTLRTIAPAAGKHYADQAESRAILVELETAGADLGGVLSSIGHELPLDREYHSSHRYPGALATAMREETAHRLGTLPPDAVIISLPAKEHDDE